MQHDLEKFEQYLYNRLSDTDRNIFEMKLFDDPEFKREYNAFCESIELIHLNNIKNQIQSTCEKPQKVRINKLIPGVILTTIILILTFTVYIFKKNKKMETIIQHYTETDLNHFNEVTLPFESIGFVSNDSNQKKIFKLFENKEYTEIINFEKIEKSNDTLVMSILALSFMKSNMYEKAHMTFKNLLPLIISEEYKSTVLLNDALCLAKIDYKRSEILLQEIQESDSKSSRLAKEILQKLTD